MIPHWTGLIESPRYINTECIGQNLSYEANFWDLSDIDSAFTGNGYLFLRLITSIPISTGYSVRMYAQTQLKQRLTPNSIYYLEYYTKNAKECSTDRGGISHQGVLLTDTLVRGPLRLGEGVTGPLEPILLDPQLETDSVVAYGTEKWFKIHHCFQADQAYEYITVGCFAEPEEILGLNYDSCSSGIGMLMAYDAFSLIEIEEELRLDYVSSTDTICAGECLTLSSNHSLIHGDFFWELPGSDIGSSSDSTVTVCYDQPGQYGVFLRAEHCAGLFEEDFPRAITVLPGIEAASVPDTTICAGESVRVDLSATGEKVCWEDGSEEVQRSFSTAGLYRYELSNGFCSRADSFRIDFYNDPVDEEVAAASCEGENFEFLGQSFSAPGIYRDTMQDVAGCDSVYFRINYDYFPEEEIPLDGEFGFCMEQESTRVSVPLNFEDISWSTGEEGLAITLNNPGNYAVSVLDENGCPQERSFEIIQYPSPEVIAVDLIDIWYTDNMPLEASYSSDVTSYNWQGEALSCTDCPEPLLLEALEQDLIIEVQNEQGCLASDTLSMRFRTANVYLPSILAKEPNLPQNGVLYAQSDVDIIYDLQVYDRWGGVLYEGKNLQSNDLTQGWRPQEDLLLGVYVYLVTYRENGQQVVLSGDVTVVR